MRASLKKHQLGAINELNQLCTEHVLEVDKMRNQKKYDRLRILEEKKLLSKMPTVAGRATEKEVLVLPTGDVERGKAGRDSRAMYDKSLERFESTMDNGSVFNSHAKAINIT